MSNSPLSRRGSSVLAVTSLSRTRMSPWSALSRTIAAGTRPAIEVGEAADADLLAALAGQGGDLGVGELEAPGDVVGVLDQDLAGGGETQSTPAALEEPDADLGLEQGDLAGHGGLRPRKTLGRTRERELVRDDAEGQKPARVHSFF